MIIIYKNIYNNINYDLVDYKGVEINDCGIICCDINSMIDVGVYHAITKSLLNIWIKLKRHIIKKVDKIELL